MEFGSATDQIYGQFLKKSKVMKHVKNSLVSFLTKLSLSTTRSVIGSHLRIVEKRLDMNSLTTLMGVGGC